MANIEALITLIIYSGALVGIGLWASRSAGSEDAFILADRGLGSVVAGLAYAASTSSAWVLLGFSGFVYSVGPSAMWMLPGILAGYAVIWFWAGRVLQDDTKTNGHLTLTDFICQHTSAKFGKWIRTAASLMIACSFSWYIAAQLQGAGQAFDDLFDSGLVIGVIIGAVLILAYTFLGGFVAVSIVDMLQGILIGVVAVILPAAAFIHVGGVPAISDMLSEAPDTYSDTFGGRAGFAALGFVVGLSATGFGALGQPHLVAWIMAAKDRKSRIEGGLIALAWGAVVYAGMGVLGLSARIMFGDNVAGEGVFFDAANELLPGIFAGIVAAATLSAIMSTVDSQFLVAGAALSHDLGLARLFPRREVLVSRLSISAVCLAAVCVTFALPSSIFERALFVWVALGATFGPIVVARALGWTPRDGFLLASMLAGFFLSVILSFATSTGPLGLWSTTGPWAGAFAILVLERAVAMQTRRQSA